MFMHVQDFGGCLTLEVTVAMTHVTSVNVQLICECLTMPW